MALLPMKFGVGSSRVGASEHFTCAHEEFLDILNNMDVVWFCVGLSTRHLPASDPGDCVARLEV